MKKYKLTDLKTGKCQTFLDENIAIAYAMKFYPKADSELLGKNIYYIKGIIDFRKVV